MVVPQTTNKQVFKMQSLPLIAYDIVSKVTGQTLPYAVS